MATRTSKIPLAMATNKKYIMKLHRRSLASEMLGGENMQSVGANMICKQGVDTTTVKELKHFYGFLVKPLHKYNAGMYVIAGKNKTLNVNNIGIYIQREEKPYLQSEKPHIKCKH